MESVKMDCYIQVKERIGMRDEIAKLYRDSEILQIMEVVEGLESKGKG